jgi:pimeloyl-ACP methyl ester carboxylesterase
LDHIDRSAPNSAGWNHQFAHVNNIDIHYVREGAGMPLFVLHGWPEFWWSWHRNIPALAQHFDVVAPDLRGFGQTEKPAGSAFESYDFQHHVADIIALADHLGFERFGIATHDVGAGVSQMLAREHAHRLTGLFLFNCAYPGVGRRWVKAEHLNEIWYQSLHQQPWATELIGHSRETCRIYFSNMLAHWSYDPHAFDAHIETWVDNFMAPGNMQGGFNWYVVSHPIRMALVRDGAPQLARIETPTRFLWGRHDPILLSSWADALGDYFRDPMVEFAEHAGHFVHFEASELANAAITEFFGGSS